MILYIRLIPNNNDDNNNQNPATLLSLGEHQKSWWNCWWIDVAHCSLKGSKGISQVLLHSCISCTSCCLRSSPVSGWEELSPWCISVVELSPHCWRVEWQTWWSGSMWCRDAFRLYIRYHDIIRLYMNVKLENGLVDGALWFTVYSWRYYAKVTMMMTIDQV